MSIEEKMAEFNVIEKKDDDSVKQGYQGHPELNLLSGIDEPFRDKTPSDLVRRILNDDFQGAVESFHYDPESERKVQNFTRFLSKTQVKVEGQYCGRIREVLRHLSPKYRDKYNVLQSAVQAWKPKRESLIENLAAQIADLNVKFKWSTIVRFVSSSADIIGSVGGLLCPSESAWATTAFQFASFCGLCGLVSTVAEVENSKRVLNKVAREIDEDQNLLKPIITWMEGDEELNYIVQHLFPHGIDMDIVKKIHSGQMEQENYLGVFRSTLLSNVREDVKLLENKDFLHSVQLFSRSEVAALWWNRILYRQHPIELDIARMSLQIQFGQIQSIIFQCIPALPLEQQRLNSPPVAGRLLLNVLTSYDAFSDLRKGPKSMHSDNLKQLLDSLDSQLTFVDQTVKDLNPWGM